MIGGYSKDIASLFFGVCNIFIFEEKFDEKSKITKVKKTLKHKNIPCRLSHKSIATSSIDNIATATKEIKLFLSNSIDVPSGSEVEVTQNNKTEVYKSSSLSTVYSSHQEILLERLETC